MIEQKTGEGGVLLQAAEIRLRHHAAEERRVSSEAVGVDFGTGVHIGAVRDQPARDLNLVEVDTDVQQGCACQRRAVQSERVVGMASQFRRIDFFMRERAPDELRIAGQMRFQKIDAAAMQRHHGRIGKVDTSLGHEFEATMLP